MNMDYEGTNPQYPHDLSDQEAAAGFERAVIDAPGGAYAFEPSRIKVVIRNLGSGKIAIKMAVPGGGASYAIWDRATAGPVEHGAASLAELAARYPLSSKPKDSK
jgi:hypothetical protein